MGKKPRGAVGRQAQAMAAGRTIILQIEIQAQAQTAAVQFEQAWRARLKDFHQRTGSDAQFGQPTHPFRLPGYLGYLSPFAGVKAIQR